MKILFVSASSEKYKVMCMDYAGRRLHTLRVNLTRQGALAYMAKYLKHNKKVLAVRTKAFLCDADVAFNVLHEAMILGLISEPLKCGSSMEYYKEVASESVISQYQISHYPHNIYVTNLLKDKAKRDEEARQVNYFNQAMRSA